MLWGISTVVLAILLAIGLLKRTRRSLPLPPGPKAYPILGNLLNMPKERQWIQFQQWSKESNSDIIHLRMFGKSTIVLNSLEASNDLLARRSGLYSSRLPMTMLHLIGQDFNLAFLPYNDDWRARRRVFWQEFNPANACDHRPIQIKWSRDLLRRLLKEPDKFLNHIRYTLGATIITIAYGLEVQKEDDPHIARSDQVLRHLDVAGIFGSFIVDHVPILKYLPRWMPGAGFLTYAESVRHETRQMLDIPYEKALELITEGKGQPSSITRALARNDVNEQVLKDVASAAYEGGADTSPTALSIFIAAMVLYPEVQAKAQKELDMHLGNRLPTFEDQPYLPYIYAILLEVLRWEPVVPLGVAHSLVEEDEYKGYHLPKNASVVSNIWAILRDESLFPDAEKFKPERFLKDGKVDPRLKDPVAAFGFGRRICPGRYMAMDSLWISMASILTVFHLAKATDGNGSEIEPNFELTPSFVRRVLPFECSIKPRSKEAERMIRNSDLV